MASDIKEGAEFENRVLYDLRQIRANFIGAFLNDVFEAMKTENFYSWYKNLLDLYDATEHAYSDKKESAKAMEGYITKISLLANKYPAAWLGKKKDSFENGEIERVMREFVRYLMREIEEAGLFGRGETWDADEI
jgi:hypothetical protein